jgi:arylsulfatase A-like enzyme
MKRFLTLLILSSLAATFPARAAERRPNFLFILADNVGRDWFSCYGSDNPTPNIDKLAAGGTRFQHCYVTPLCSTTRVQLLTGRYGFSTGWHTHHDAAIYGGGGLDPKRETTWARALRDAGYATAIAGKWQINDLYDQRDALKQHGFDEHLVWTGALVGEGLAEARWKASIAPGGNRELESRYWDPIVFRNGAHETLTGKFGPDEYAGFLTDFMARHREKPFIAYYACPFVHIPTVTTPLSPDKNAPEREQFAGMVRYMDAQVGRLVADVERLGLRDNTIIIFLPDNGTPAKLSGMVGGKKAAGGLGTLSENGLDVPLIVNCPARVATNRESKALVDCSDFFPTLMELAGAPTPRGLAVDGKSFAAQLRRNAEPPPGREWIFAQYAGERVMRDQRFKLYASGGLFDVEAHPLEKNDLAASADREVVAAKQRLQQALATLPPKDAELGFPFRSSSAFNAKEGKGKAAKPKGAPKPE